MTQTSPSITAVKTTELTLGFTTSYTYDSDPGYIPLGIRVKITWLEETNTGTIFREIYNTTFGFNNELSCEATVSNFKVESGQPYVITSELTTKNIDNEIFVPLGGQSTITIYTHPGKFQMGAIQGGLVSSVLNQEKIESWAKHVEKAMLWYACNNEIDLTVEKINEIQNMVRKLTVISGKTITAEWFRKCLRALNSVREPEYQFKEEEINSIVGLEESKINGKTPTTITADLINKLNFSGIESAIN